MLDLNKFSPENLVRFQKVLKILLDELELQGINELVGNKIPIEKFEKEGFSRDDVLVVFDRINEKNKLIRLCFIEESSDFNNLEFYPPKTELEKMEFWAQKRAESERYISFIVINLEKLKKTKEEVDKTIKEKEEIMEREKGRPVKIFTNEVIPDRTAEIEKQMREEQIRQSERIEREILHREQMKQDRILRTSVDKYTHALDLIIERAEYAEDGNSFSIEFYDFNFEQMIGSKMLEKFLTEMQKDGCFEKYERTNYAGGTRFSFIKVNIKNLKKFKEKREVKSLPSDKKQIKETALYLNQNGDLYREPKDRYCYPMDEKSNRHKIIRFLATNKGYQFTEFISTELGIESEKTIRTEIGKMRSNIEKYLKIDGKDFLQGKKESGYRINPKYKITFKNE